MKKIKFIAKDKLSEHILTPPEPSSLKVPKWYKDLSPYMNPSIKNHKNYFLKNNLTAKACVPIFDAINAGYMVELPCDVQFVDPAQNEMGYRALWDVSWDVLDLHTSDQVGDIGIPENFDKSAWKLMSNWRIKTPKGYSLLYTHPFYRYDLPFITATGIVDSDIYDFQVNLPFFIKKDFTGTIEKGTPIAQVIPIKRENWKSEVLGCEESHEFAYDKLKLISRGAYKKLWWQKKHYK
jgi:hypothetical protein